MKPCLLRISAGPWLGPALGLGPALAGLVLAGPARPAAPAPTTAPAPAPLHFVLDGAASDVSAKVAFVLVASKTARFPDVRGGISLSPDRLDHIELNVTLDAHTLTAPDPITEKRLKGAKFFDVAHFPQVHFSGKRLEMTGERTGRLDGLLTARGVTRPVTLDVVFDEPPARATARDGIALVATVAINRDDFGMTAYHFIVGRTVTIRIAAQMIPG